MADKIIRVLLVEDSKTSTQLLTKYLNAEQDIEVVASVTDGLEAAKIVPKIKPDIILMDINLPIMNGFEATKEIMRENPTPILLISSEWNLEDVKVVLKDMGVGALAALDKPRGPADPAFRKNMDDLICHVRLLSQISVVRRLEQKKSSTIHKRAETTSVTANKFKLVAIGASTGGPPVLREILKDLPADYPLPILVVQHMSGGFIDNFVEWMNGQCLLNVKKGVDGEKILPGNIYFGSDGHHIEVYGGKIKLSIPQAEEMFVPSVCKLFSSASEFYPKETVAIILSGMGKDGSAATKRLKENGALTIAQNEASSVVFGMAKEAIRLDGITITLSPQEIKELLLKLSDVKDKR